MEHCPKSVHFLGVQNAMNDLIRRPQKIDASGRVIHDPRIPADRWRLNIPPSMNGGKKVRLFFKMAAEAKAERKRRIEAHEGAPPDLRTQLDERGATATDAINYYLKHAPKTQTISVAEGCNRFFLSREASNCKPRYISTLKSTLKPFVAKFAKRMMHEIQKDDLELYVQRLTAKDGRTQAAPRTRANTVGYLKALFTFAVEEGWRGESPAATLRKPIPDETAVSILSPGDVAKLIETALQEAYHDILPALLLQLYAGPRRAEVPHIHWANIKDKYLRLSITKVREVRAVALPAELIPWLERLRNGDARVLNIHGVAFSDSDTRGLEDAYTQRLVMLASEAGVATPRNVFRHTAITYRLLATQNSHETALWAGNSPSIIDQHYRGAATEDDAIAFYAVLKQLEPSLERYVASLPRVSKALNSQANAA